MKEQYIKMRNAKQVDFNFLYNYATNNGFKGDETMFRFVMQFADIPMVFEHLDRKFGLTLLVNKDGSFIKIVE